MIKKLLFSIFLFSIFTAFTQEPQRTFIPDDNFEQTLIDLGFDDLLDDYVLTANIETLTELNINAKGVIDLTGLQDFKELEILFCAENYRDGLYISEIDISSNTNLKELFCSFSTIESINLENNLLLETLSVPFSFIKEIDLSANNKLKMLDIGDSKITVLDVSTNPNLGSLIASGNEILVLDLSQNLLLKHLNVTNTPITNIDVSKQKMLESFEVRQSLLTQLDLVENTSLEDFDARYSTSLSCIQVPDVAAAVDRSQWLKDDLAVYSVDCSSNNATQTFVPDDNFEQVLIDLGYDDIIDDYVITAKLTEIVQLDLNQSGALDLTGLEAFSNLEWLRLDNRLPGSAPIKNIDVAQNLNLETLLLPGNDIKEIDLSKNDKLRGLDLESNQVEVIDLSNNPNLQSIVLYGNKLKELDLSKNEKLELYILSNNELTSLNLQNGNNRNFGESVELAGNPNLECIQVDNAEFSSNNQYWIKDDTASFSEDCSIFITDSDNDGVPNDLDICPNTPAGTIVDVNGCELSIADLVLENIQISIGSDPCSEAPSCYIAMRSLKDIPLDIYIEKGNHEVVFEGVLNDSNPIELNDLAEGDYNILVVGNEFIPRDYAWKVAFYSDNNEIETTVGITKPDQTYSIGVSGSTTYWVNVNGTTTALEYDSVEEQQLEIPLVIGLNKITVNGFITCDAVNNTEDDDSGKSSDNLLLFPTLSDGLITIENNKENQIHGITVTGLNGVTTKYISINGNPKEMHIDMQGTAKGMYIVRIQQASGKTILKKILIQ